MRRNADLNYCLCPRYTVCFIVILTLMCFFFTAMCEMMKIMQENREVTCCLGSSANFRNSRLFLQSDLRYTHIDIVHPLTFVFNY